MTDATDTTSTTPSTSPYPPYGIWLLVGSVLASGMAFIDGSALSVALPVLQKELQATGSDLLWVLNGYLLMKASLLLVGGSLGDMLGRKRVFITGIVMFVLASMACGFAPTIELLIAARVVQGLGGAAMLPGSLSLLSALFPIDIRGQAIGIWSAASALVTVIGPALGGLLADYGLWRWLFFINLPLGAFAIYALSKVPESVDEEARNKKIDYMGALFATMGLGGVTYGFIRMADHGVDGLAWASVILGAVAMVGFVLWELSVEHPMVPMNVFRVRTFSATNVVTLLLYAALQVFTVFFSYNMVEIQGYSPTVAGVAFLPFALMVVLLSGWSGSLADRFGPRPLLIAGTTASGLSFLWLSFIGINESISDMWVTFVPGLILFGIGMALTVAPLTAAVMTALPDQQSGVASGVNNAVARGASVLGIAIIGSFGLSLFGSELALELAEVAQKVGLSSEMSAQFVAESSQLAQIPMPESATAEQREAFEWAIKLAFVEMHQAVMQICAGLSFASAFIAFLFVDRKKG